MSLGVVVVCALAFFAGAVLGSLGCHPSQRACQQCSASYRREVFEARTQAGLWRAVANPGLAPSDLPPLPWERRSADGLLGYRDGGPGGCVGGTRG